MIGNSRRPLLGIVGTDYLREALFRRCAIDSDTVAFSLPDAITMRFASFAVPLQSLDLSPEAFERSMQTCESRGLRFRGLLSTRDWNCLGVAKAASQRGLPTMPVSAAETLTNKFRARSWLNDNVPVGKQFVLPTILLDANLDFVDFQSRIVMFLRKHGASVLKPNRGSCSYFVHFVTDEQDIGDAWLSYRRGRNFRGGEFVLEKRAFGREITADVFAENSDNTRVVFASYIERRSGSFAEMGIHIPADIDDNQAARSASLVQDIVRGMRLFPFAGHVELILSDDGLPPAIVEINPRLAGDMMPELYRLTIGIDLYRIAGRLAMGIPLDSEVTDAKPAYIRAHIQFLPPGSKVRGEVPESLFQTAHDRFGRLNTVGVGKNTNDDRPGFALVFGDDRVELESRARDILDAMIR